MRKIVFADDFLRPRSEGQILPAKYARFCHELWKTQFELLCPGITIKCTWEDGMGRELREIFYSSIGAIPERSVWLKLYDADFISRQRAELIANFENALVVGFDLSPALMKGLQKEGIPWLNFTRHPARFIKELPLMVTGNIPELERLFQPYLLTDEMIKIQAAMLKATLACRGLAQHEEYEGSDAALFLCQSADDPEKITNGRMCVMENFQQEIFEIVKKHSFVFVKHIDEIDPERPDFFLTQLCPNTKLIEDNLYFCMANPAIKIVYSLSSSQTDVAGYFGKTSQILGKHNSVLSQFLTQNKPCLSVYNISLRPELWANILRALNFPVTEYIESFKTKLECEFLDGEEEALFTVDINIASNGNKPKKELK